MASESLINARRISRHYGQFCAVDQLDLELHQGEVLGLLGPNGAGKSSTLRMLAGELAPDSGHISIAGIDLRAQPRHAKAQIGYLPERPPLYADATVDEYLGFCARLHRVPKNTIKTVTGDAKARCGLSEVGRRLIGNLSRGYQQRVGIAQAILHTPRIVILDEPTVGLDPLQIADIRALIRAIGEEHSVILSTHILSEVQAVCQRVQIIHQGRTVFADSLGGLEARHRKPALFVRFANPPAPERLQELTGVENVETLPAGRIRITHGEHSIAEALTRAAVEHGWKLEELTPEQASLEQIFMNLVYRDTENPGDQQAPA